MKTKSFNQLAAAQKRVAIAKDAIAQIVAGRFIIQHGKYFDWNGSGEAGQSELTDEKTVCTVCQLGATMASAVRLFNSVSVSKNGCNDSEVLITLGHWFEASQISLMEGCFELDNSWLTEGFAVDADLDAIAAFKRKHKSFHKRSLAIFRNIIANKGEFKP